MQPQPPESFSNEVIAGESCPHKSAFYEEFSARPAVMSLALLLVAAPVVSQNNPSNYILPDRCGDPLRWR